MPESKRVFESNLYFDGKWTGADGTATIESVNPADPATQVAEFPSATASDTTSAISAANAAQSEWQSLNPHERGAFLRDTADVVETRKEAISELVVDEVGKTIDSARGEVQRTIDLLNYYAEVARDNGGIAPPSAQENTVAYTTREPWGTVGAITPWNYPIAIPTWKLAPALVGGNTAVLKPASQAPAVGSALVDAFDEAGIPAGVVNLVTGSGSTVGTELVTHDDIDVVSFTGSYEVGHGVYQEAAASGKRVQCEMGGKNPLIVDDSADLDLAVELTIAGGLAGLAGQACTATSRIVVFEDVHDAYLDKLLATIDDMAVADPLDEQTDMGPKASKDGLNKDLRYIDVGQTEGATLETGGSEIEGRDGYYVEPTVFSDVDPNMRIAQEEIFGPVLSVIEVADYEEAIDVANDVRFGLTASICTNRLDHTKEFIDDIETGVVKINQTTSGVEMQMPFGGRKNSSTETFKEQGRQALDFYTHEKAVYISH